MGIVMYPEYEDAYTEAVQYLADTGHEVGTPCQDGSGVRRCLIDACALQDRDVFAWWAQEMERNSIEIYNASAINKTASDPGILVSSIGNFEHVLQTLNRDHESAFKHAKVAAGNFYEVLRDWPSGVLHYDEMLRVHQAFREYSAAQAGLIAAAKKFADFLLHRSLPESEE